MNLKVFENTCVEPHIINHVCILLEAFQKKTSCKARAGVVMSRGVQACGLEIRVYILRNQMVHFGIGESDGANSATHHGKAAAPTDCNCTEKNVVSID